MYIHTSFTYPRYRSTISSPTWFTQKNTAKISWKMGPMQPAPKWPTVRWPRLSTKMDIYFQYVCIWIWHEYVYVYKISYVIWKHIYWNCRRWNFCLDQDAFPKIPPIWGEYVYSVFRLTLVFNIFQPLSVSTHLTHLTKYARRLGSNFPGVGVKIRKYLKPPPR